MHFVYIVRCADGTLYTGYARDPVARERAHNHGRGAKYTVARRPVTLVYAERLRTRGKALKREYALKRLSRARKLALVDSFFATSLPSANASQGADRDRRYSSR